MANKFAGEIQLRLDKVRTLKLDFNALCAFEERMGGSILWLLGSGSILQNLGFRTVRALVWAGLRHESPPPSIEEAGDMCQAGDGETELEKLVKILPLVLTGFSSLRDPEAKKRVEAAILEGLAAVGGSTGTSSSGSDAASAA